jgi:hypothetical protein
MSFLNQFCIISQGHANKSIVVKTNKISERSLSTIGTRLKVIAEPYLTVLRIRDVYPGSEFSIPDPGSASKNLSILTQKNGF